MSAKPVGKAEQGQQMNGNAGRDPCRVRPYNSATVSRIAAILCICANVCAFLLRRN